ncbi:MAG: hypothetical protein MK078_01820 [Crocinitomicaceae bacterium]|nr:hypothetical protein [Crocinitomicaceae bacterium]
MQKRTINILLWAFGGLVYLYILIRCFTLEPFIDEIWNFHLYVKTGDYNPFTAHLDANNHFISTFLNRLSFLIFGDNFIAMRLVESAFFILFFNYLMKIRSIMKNKKLGAFLVLTLCSIFFINSFFSLARGYGISLALLTGAIFHLIEYANHFKLKDILFISVFGSLAIWSNLAFIPIIGLVFLLGILISIQNKDFKSIFLLILIGGIPYFAGAIHALELKAAGELYIGGKTGFYSDVILNLPNELLGFEGVWMFLVWGFLTGIFIFLNLKKISWNKNSGIILILFISTLFSAILMHVFMGINYPQNRVAIHFILLGVLSFYFLLDMGEKFWIVGVYPFTIFLLHSLTHFNFSYSAPWQQNVLMRNDITIIENEQRNQEELFTLSSPFSFKSYVHYFNYDNPFRMNVPQWKDFPSETADYLITTYNQAGVNQGLYDTVYTNPISGVTIFERSEKVLWKPLANIQVPPISSRDSLISILKLDLQPESNMMKVSYTGNLQTNDEAAIGFLVINISNEAEVFGEEFIMLDRYFNNFSAYRQLEIAHYFNKLPKETIDVEVYLLNISRSEWNLEDFKISLSQTN